VTLTVAHASMLIVSADAHFTSGMPTKRLAADCVLTDEAGRLLMLDPPYKVTWDIPGGIVEVDESSRRAVQREVLEEIGLDIELGRLLVVDWKPRDGDFTEVVALLFDGGTLTAWDIDRIVTDPSEVLDTGSSSSTTRERSSMPNCLRACPLDWKRGHGTGSSIWRTVFPHYALIVSQVNDRPA